MDKLKKQFLRIRERYQERRPEFLKKIEKWNRRASKNLYKQGNQLLKEADACNKDIVEIFDTTDWKNSRGYLKVKINLLKDLNKELSLLSRSFFRKWIEAFIVIFGVAIILRVFFFGLYHVPTSSGEQTLLVGDRVWVNKIIYHFDKPMIGDIVTFRDPDFIYDTTNAFQTWWQRYIGIDIPLFNLKIGPALMAKRIIAAPGDKIEGKIEDGKAVVYRNGKKLVEPYVNKLPLLAMRKITGFFERDKFFEISIPEVLRKKKKFVLYSYDSAMDFEQQPFYFVDYKQVIFDQVTGLMKTIKTDVLFIDKEGNKVDTYGSLHVPIGKYWVMGDNRRNSVDSREWGLIDGKDISGKATHIVWSLDSEEPFWFFELIKHPVRFWQSIRLDRFFKKIG